MHQRTSFWSLYLIIIPLFQQEKKRVSQFLPAAKHPLPIPAGDVFKKRVILLFND
jgi:hypothetical protein